MKITAFRKQGGGSEEQFRSQTNSEAAFSNISRTSILDGVLLENVSITTAGISVEHKLNRDYRGYIICKNDTFCDIKVNTDTNKKLFINLQSTANCVVSLWVF